MSKAVNANAANGVPTSLQVPTTNDPINPSDLETPVKAFLDGIASVNDRITNVTADPSAALPTTNGPRSLVAWLSALVRRVKEIAGTTNWWDALPASLTTLDARVDVLEAAGNFTVEALHTVGTAGQPAFQNGASGTVTFYRDPLGVVRLSGTATLSAGGLLFTLPAGYRPAVLERFLAPDASGSRGVLVGVYPDGSVTTDQLLGAAGNPGSVALSAVSFRVA